MSSDNASSAVTYTSVSSDSNGPPSWGIPLENADEIPEIDPYEEVAQQRQAHPLSPAYVHDLIELDEHPYADDASPTAESPGYIADSDSMEDNTDTDSIDYPDEPGTNDEDPEEDDDEDPEEDPSEEHDPEDEDEDPEEDPSEENEIKDEDAKEDESFEDSATPPPPRHRGARISAPLGHREAMIRMRDDILEEDMPPQRRFVLTAPPLRCDVAESSATAAARAPRGQYDFVDDVETRQGLIHSPGHDARTIARVADRVEDVGYACKRESKDFYTQLLDARTDRIDIRLEIDVVRGQRTAYETELHERAEDDVVRQIMRTQVLEAKARFDTVEDAGSSCIVGLSQWIKKMGSVFHISSCVVENQVKFAACTLLGAALTWWNGHNLKVKGNDVAAYTHRFQELALMCTKFLADETAKIEKYIGGLLDNIHGNVMSARPKTLDFAIELANDLMDQKLRTYAKRQNENKKKADDSSRNHHQQQPHKKQNVARAYTVGPGEKKVYTEDLPLCTKCNYHHTGQCAPKCGKYKRYDHATTDFWVNTNNNNNNNNKNQKAKACYECGNTGHRRRDCPKLKNHRNGNGNGTAQGRAYALGGRDASPDPNVITGTFILNDRYATILFDTGADRSFVSNTFSASISITPTTLENHYDVELADGKIIGVNTIIRGCTLNFMNHPFNVNLMPIPLGSFDIIVGMDWLTKYHGVIICDEKIVCVPFGKETLIFQGDGSNPRKESWLNIILCTKAQEYLSMGCDVFLAHITTNEAKDKMEEK
ncbi:putative reverse transcriptase domain-containing protein [Tanacetum coccineum]